MAIRVRCRILYVLLSPLLNTTSWHSVLEMQAFLVILIQKFEISLADHQPQIKRSRPGLIIPLVLGEEYKGAQLPLKITAIRNA